MLIRNYTMRGVVEFIRDWHPARVATSPTKRYKDHTRGGLMYQEIILNDKMKSCEERVKRKLKEKR
jgi:hypothetical protein